MSRCVVCGYPKEAHGPDLTCCGSAGFLAGTIFSTVMVIAGGGRGGMVALGFLLAVAFLAGAISLAGISRTARFFNALDDAPGRRSDKSANTIGYKRPSKKQQLDILSDTVSEYKERMSKPAARPTHNLDFLNDSELFGDGKVM